MIDQAARRLDELARTDPVAAPLAALHAEVLRAAADPAWEAGVPAFTANRLGDGLPLLHGQTLAVDPERIGRLLLRLSDIAAASGSAAGTGPDRIASVRQALRAPALDPLATLEAIVAQDTARLEAVAGAADVDLDALAVLGQLAAVPLLRACGRRAAPLLEGAGWEAGYCPVCAAWPALAELRGLERRRWLRCGRCGAGWTYFLQRCVYCANADHRTTGYLAAEADRESRRALTCDECHGYLKAVATLGELVPGEIAVHDLGTLELDAAALGAGYGRPEAPGFPLEVRVVAAEAAEAPAQRRRGWRAWRR